MEENRIEGLWDCAACDTTGIKARFSTCPGCGRARGEETIFYLPEDLQSAYLTPEEAAQTTNEPDWVCEYCGSLNRAGLVFCITCGGEYSASKKNYGMLHKLTGKLFGKKK